MGVVDKLALYFLTLFNLLAQHIIGPVKLGSALLNPLFKLFAVGMHGFGTKFTLQRNGNMVRYKAH